MPSLPRLMVVTNRQQMAGGFMPALRQALEGGAPWIQLREKDLDARIRRDLALEASEMCRQYGALLSVNTDAALARELNAGLHLPDRASPPPHGEEIWPLGRSIHHVDSLHLTPAECCHYLLYGHVFATASHQGQPARGTVLLKHLAEMSSWPLYAIGGINERNAAQCLRCGAYGIAVMGAIWQSSSASAAVSGLMRILEAAAAEGTLSPAEPLER